MGWSEFMKAQGITRGLSLMTDEEMSWFAEPGLLYAGVLPAYDHVITTRAGAAKDIVAKLRAAEEAGDKVVVHCCAGQHRTGTVLAAWLVERHGLSPADAAQEVLQHADSCNVRRGAEAHKIQQFLKN